MAISRAVRDAVRSALTDAPHGARTATARRLARTLGISVSTVYRAAGIEGAKRPRAPARPEYREWTRTIVWIAHQKGPEGEPLPIDQAVEIGIEGGALPPEAAEVPAQTVRRIARELGLALKHRRTRRLDADYPMQAVQCDGSTSKRLAVVRELDDGDWLLKLYRRPYPASGYKNKALGPGRERVIYYGTWDMCTGYTLSRATVARGETAFDEMSYLDWAFSAKADGRIPFHGRPDEVWADGGNLFRHRATTDLIVRAGSVLNPGRPYNKERMGGVERSHRTRWRRFEGQLFARGAETIRLSELNARLLEYHIRENARRPSRTAVAGRRASRTEAWIALTNARPADNRLERWPENAIETLAQERPDAWIDANGHVTWGGVYEVPGWHSMHVIARRSLTGDSDHIIVEHPRTKERRVAHPYETRPYGTVRAQAATPLDRLLEEGRDVAGADIYAPGRNTADPMVAPIPARSVDAAPIEDPLDAGRYPDVATALAAFETLYPHPLRPEHRALVVERITEAGLATLAVVELAQGLTALAAQGGKR